MSDFGQHAEDRAMQRVYPERSRGAHGPAAGRGRLLGGHRDDPRGTSRGVSAAEFTNHESEIANDRNHQPTRPWSV